MYVTICSNMGICRNDPLLQVGERPLSLLTLLCLDPVFRQGLVLYGRAKGPTSLPRPGALSGVACYLPLTDSSVEGIMNPTTSVQDRVQPVGFSCGVVNHGVLLRGWLLL